MTRLKELNPHNLTDHQKDMTRKLTEGPRQGVGGPFKAWLYSPAFAEKAEELGTLLRFETSLPRRLSELAILMTAHFWQSDFVWYGHFDMALDAGLNENIIDQIRGGRWPIFEDGETSAFYAFVRELLHEGRVTDSTWAKMAEFLNEKAIVELIGLIGYYCSVALTINAFQITPEKPPVAWDPLEHTQR